MTEGELLFEGNVSLKQGYRQVTADQVTADRAGETATATGNVIFREPGILIRGSRIDYDSQSEEAIVTDALRHSRSANGRLSGTAQATGERRNRN